VIKPPTRPILIHLKSKAAKLQESLDREIPEQGGSTSGLIQQPTSLQEEAAPGHLTQGEFEKVKTDLQNCILHPQSAFHSQLAGKFITHVYLNTELNRLYSQTFKEVVSTRNAAQQNKVVLEADIRKLRNDQKDLKRKLEELIKGSKPKPEYDPKSEARVVELPVVGEPNTSDEDTSLEDSDSAGKRGRD
jgi:hypothetical protein